MRKPLPRTLARRGTRGLLIGLIGALVLCLGGGLLLGPADAAPGDKPTPTKHQVQQAQSTARAAAKAVGTGQARLAQVQAQLDKLNRDAEIAAEAYDGAVYKLGLADQAARQARKRASAAQAQYDAAQRIVSRFAVAAYRSGADFGSADVYLGVDGPGGAVTRADTLAAVGAQVTRALLVASSTKIVASVLRQQANAALAAQRKAEQAVQDAKRRADTAVANQQSKVASLQSELTRLRTELSSAKSTAKHLSKARKVGLAQAALERKLARERAARAAAARKAAERAAAERAAAEQSSSDSSGGSGSVVSVGASARGTSAGAARAIAYARKQLGKPYVYAADGPAAFDCSGLTMRAWQAGGVSLPHWSVAQYEQSQPVSPGEARPGDLVFFASNPSDYRTIYHVGLYIGGGMMIEAPHTGDVVKIYAVYPNDFLGYARP